MIEDALVEANRFEEASVMAGIKKGINAVANAFTGKNNQQQQTQEQPQQNATLDTIKGYLKDNPDPADWPADRLNDLIAFLKTQKDFMNSKKAQAALQAIQQQENEAKAKGKESSDNINGEQNVSTNGTGDPNKVLNNIVLKNAINRGLESGISVDDIIAYAQKLKK